MWRYARINEVAKRLFRRRARKLGFDRIDQDELDLHPLGQDALDVNRNGRADRGELRRIGGAVLRKSREVRRELDEHAVRLDRAYDPRNGLARLEERGVLLPRSEQLLHCEKDTVLLTVDRFDRNRDAVARSDAVARMRDP